MDYQQSERELWALVGQRGTITFETLAATQSSFQKQPGHTKI